MTRAKPGRDGRPTPSFTFDEVEDRTYWESLSDQTVQIVLISVDGNAPQRQTSVAPITVVRSASTPRSASSARKDSQFPHASLTAENCAGRVFCIGLDLAWFGGSAGNSKSQYDVFAYAIVDTKTKEVEQFRYKRVPLQGSRTQKDEFANCDPESELLLQSIEDTLSAVSGQTQDIILCVDAPLVAENAEGESFRSKTTKKGCKLRECEAELRKACRGYGANWTPNIQPGGPLCKRVVRLMEKVVSDGFTVFPKLSNKMIFECYPAEAIWAGFVQSSERNCKAYLEKGISLPDADEVKAYKRPEDGNWDATSIDSNPLL